MPRIRKPFSFDYTLTHKVVRNLKIETETVGVLTIEGYAYINPNGSVLDINDRYAYDIDFIKYNGVDIRPVLEALGTMDQIEEATLQHTSKLFNSQEAAA